MDGKNRSVEPREQSLSFLVIQASVSAANGAQLLKLRTQQQLPRIIFITQSTNPRDR
jgi:hypothetical protein